MVLDVQTFFYFRDELDLVYNFIAKQLQSVTQVF